MFGRSLRPLREALGWVLFPAVPAVLASFYHGTFSFGADPRVWSAEQWYVLTGPLVGFGFLAGAALDLPDPEGLRGPRRLLARRAVWVAIGPWLGLLVFLAIYYAIEWSAPLLGDAAERWSPPDWFRDALGNALFFGLLPAGWLVVALAALLRARRLGRLRRALARGLATAAAFLGSLFGGFWAATEVWRSYFFDPRVLQALLVAATALTLCGCGTVTLGDQRRRDLYGAMLTAWTLGLALAWRWWSRPRGRG